MGVEKLVLHIETTPGVAGGKPRIAGHRITVQDIVLWHERLSLDADEIATEHDLSLADVHAALRTGRTSSAHCGRQRGRRYLVNLPERTRASTEQ
jgi:uncharacterized protein (DUF433 family)